MPEHQAFDEKQFYRAFASDLQTARFIVIIQSPFLRRRQIEELQPVLGACLKRSVRICVFTQEPRKLQDHLKSGIPDALAFQDAVVLLRSWGVHVTLRQDIHEKLVVVDNLVVWEGSLNLLSHNRSHERMTRWSSQPKIEEVLRMHRLYDCDECRAKFGIRLLSHKPRSEGDRLAFLGQCMRRRRELLGLCQRDVAAAAGIGQNTLSQFETGKRNLKVSTILRLVSVLELELVPAPKSLLPAIEDLFR